MWHTHTTPEERGLELAVVFLPLLVVGNLGLLSCSYYYGTRSTKVKATSCLRRRVSGGGGRRAAALHEKNYVSWSLFLTRVILDISYLGGKKGTDSGNHIKKTRPKFVPRPHKKFVRQSVRHKSGHISLYGTQTSATARP